MDITSQADIDQIIPKYSNNTGFPSVSDIISPEVRNKNFFQKHDYSFRGRVVHEVIRNLMIPPHNLSGPLVEIAMSYKPYILGVKDMIEVFEPEPILIEHRVTNVKKKYTGQMDFIGKINNREGIGIIDWKTSKAKYKWWPIQLSAYAMLVESEENSVIKKIDWVASVRIRDNGRKPLIDFYDAFRIIYKKKFLPLLDLYYLFNN